MKKLKIFESSSEYTLQEAKDIARQISKDERCVQHVEKHGDGYRISDWYDSDLTVATFTNGYE